MHKLLRINHIFSFGIKSMRKYKETVYIEKNNSEI